MMFMLLFVVLDVFGRSCFMCEYCINERFLWEEFIDY